MRADGSSRARQTADLLVRNAPAADGLAELRSKFEDLAARCTEAFAELAPVPMEVALRDLVSGGSADVFAAHGEFAVIAAFQAPDRRSLVLIGGDDAFFGLFLEAVFGSDGSEPRDGSRVPTRIEMRLAGSIFEQAAEALRLSVFGADAAPLEREAVETAEKLPAAVRRDEPAFLARFGLSALEREGEMFVVVPQAALRGVRQTAAGADFAVPQVQDARWSQRIEHEVRRTQVTLQAVLDERELTLGEISELRVGQVLPLKATPRSNVKLVCNDQTLFWCELGQTEGAYTLRIKDFPDEQQELIDAITSQ